MLILATWGISDAILHGAALDYAVEAFEDIRQSGLGLYACVTFPETSTKALAMFGIVSDRPASCWQASCP